MTHSDVSAAKIPSSSSCISPNLHQAGSDKREKKSLVSLSQTHTLIILSQEHFEYHHKSSKRSRTLERESINIAVTVRKAFEAPRPLGVMATDMGKETVDLLRFLALSLNVHADAVACAVDDVEKTLVESSVNNEELLALEKDLQTLLERQRHLNAGRLLLSRAKAEREHDANARRSSLLKRPLFGEKAFQISRSTPLPSSDRVALSETSRSGAQVVGGKQRGERCTAQMEAGGTAPAPRSPGVAECEADWAASTSSAAPSDRRGVMDEASSVDEQVRIRQRRLAELDRFAVLQKVRRLEELKKKVCGVDIQRIVDHATAKFRMPDAVHRLWKNSKNPNSEDDLIDHTNIDLLLSRGCQRFTGRCIDALGALAGSSVTEESSPAHVLGCVIYAGEFDDRSSGEIGSVVELQTLGPEALSLHHRDLLSQATVEAPVAPRCLGQRDTVLSPYEYCAIPQNWPSAVAVSNISLGEVLPPTRHFLTPRFSFSDAAELRALQSARVRIQQSAVNRLFDRRAMESVLMLSRGADNAKPDDKGEAVAALRCALSNAASEMMPLSQHSWKTVLSAQNPL